MVFSSSSTVFKPNQTHLSFLRYTEPLLKGSMSLASHRSCQTSNLPSLKPINHQLHTGTIADKRRHHEETAKNKHEELALLEEVEELALEDMKKLLKMMDGQHPLPQIPNQHGASHFGKILA